MFQLGDDPLNVGGNGPKGFGSNLTGIPDAGSVLIDATDWAFNSAWEGATGREKQETFYDSVNSFLTEKFGNFATRGMLFVLGFILLIFGFVMLSNRVTATSAAREIANTIKG